MKTLISTVTSFALLVATGLDAAHPVGSEEDHILAMIEHPQRLEMDLKRDENRRPYDVLDFYNVRPGMTVLDVFSGGGYYSELFSLAVGPQGRVIAHNNLAYSKYVEKTLAKRYANNRLKNVENIIQEANELNVPANSADMAFLILAYHDIYYAPKKGSWPKIDRKLFLSHIYDALKPGGILGIIDHQAAPGSPASTGHSLHRINVDLVIQQVKEAGFILKERAYFLENETDDLSKHMYAPENRGKTSRFVLKFIKPLDLEQQIVDERTIP